MVEGLTLRAGTIYRVEVAGDLSAPQRLDEDLEVDLLSSGPSYRVYRLPDGRWAYVRREDDAPVPLDAL